MKYHQNQAPEAPNQKKHKNQKNKQTKKNKQIKPQKDGFDSYIPSKLNQKPKISQNKLCWEAGDPWGWNGAFRSMRTGPLYGKFISPALFKTHICCRCPCGPAHTMEYSYLPDCLNLDCAAGRPVVLKFVRCTRPAYVTGGHPHSRAIRPY